LSLVEYVDIFEGAKLAVEKVSGDVGKKIQTKLKDVLARNPGIQTIMDVAVIHREGVGTTPLTIKQTSALKFAPVTSCDVERSFSHYNSYLCDELSKLIFTGALALVARVTLGTSLHKQVSPVKINC
jgi:hypothetical protein